MRINPILEWNYKIVWEYLLQHELPYCKLYDKGYTSLGATNNTLQNPLLQVSPGTFSPAYALPQPDSEREGRNSSNSLSTSASTSSTLKN